MLILYLQFCLDKLTGNMEQQRKFLDKLARDKGFDPISEAERWYTVTQKDILSRKVRCFGLLLSC